MKLPSKEHRTWVYYIAALCGIGTTLFTALTTLASEWIAFVFHLLFACLILRDMYRRLHEPPLVQLAYVTQQTFFALIMFFFSCVPLFVKLFLPEMPLSLPFYGATSVLWFILLFVCLTSAYADIQKLRQEFAPATNDERVSESDAQEPKDNNP